tara:strand:- start:749 stop:1462 length:714 start_codon:yes stop_codon:yes gene_type:complete
MKKSKKTMKKSKKTMKKSKKTKHITKKQRELINKKIEDLYTKIPGYTYRSSNQNKCDKNEVICKELLHLSKKYNCKLINLQYRVKSKDRLSSKIKKRINSKTDIDKIIDGITDYYRFTFVIPFNRYIKVTKAINKILMNKYENAKPDKQQNRWDFGDFYQGINAVYKNNDITFEVQYHTPESLDMKEHIHKIYEDYQKIIEKLNYYEKEVQNPFNPSSFTRDGNFKRNENKMIRFMK